MTQEEMKKLIEDSTEDKPRTPEDLGITPTKLSQGSTINALHTFNLQGNTILTEGADLINSFHIDQDDAEKKED